MNCEKYSNYFNNYKLEHSYESTRWNFKLTAKTRVICQDFTKKQRTYHSKQAIEYGITMLGEVSPGKRGKTHLDSPVFNSVEESRKATDSDATVIYVSAGAAAAIIEALEDEMPLIVCISEVIPQRDIVKVRDRLLRQNKC
ncbi:hypothetical protein WA026_018166 [Henosepilachna vigintioctopunctata]|uniref:CoA-binding domain-containing protein n=1 Tax=Henosepilachna vigintioctopunctata TaxID=420089 RepID=A0AAW1UN82_9CUCU